MPDITTRDGKTTKLADISDHDALMFAIGEYVIAFANADRILAQLVSEIMEISGPHIQFLWRDAGFRTKTRGVRRAARERLGEDDVRFKALGGILNRLENRSRYRNDLMHGAFAADASNLYAGRDGNSYQQFETGFEKIDYTSVLAEADQLRGLVNELQAWDCR